LLRARNPFLALLDIRPFDSSPGDAVRGLLAPGIERMLPIGIVEGFPVNILGVGRKMVTD
jgi:hypothetical protein